MNCNMFGISILDVTIDNARLMSTVPVYSLIRRVPVISAQLLRPTTDKTRALVHGTAARVASPTLPCVTNETVRPDAPSQVRFDLR